MSADGLDLPEFLKRPIVQMGEDGKLHTEELFSLNEAHFGGISVEQLILKVAYRLQKKMEKGGAIEPYVYSVEQTGAGLCMRAEEL